MNWPLYLIVGALTAFWLLWRFKNRRMIEMAKKLPGPRALPFLGNALLFMGQPEGMSCVGMSIIVGVKMLDMKEKE